MRADEARRILGVNVRSTPADVKAAYRQRVKAWHPDRFAEDARLRAEAEAEIKRIIEAYRVLQHADEEPEPDAGPSPEAPGGSMFTVRTAPHHTATAAWAEHRRREERERERRLWRRRQVRRAAALLAGVVLVVSAWRTLAWVGSFMRPVLPPAAGAVAVRTQNSMRVLALSVDFVDERVSLVDQTACFDPGEVSASRKCLEARAIERLSGDPVTTALPHNTPAYRKILCSALQSSFDRGVYEACVLEVLTARVLAGKK